MRAPTRPPRSHAVQGAARRRAAREADPRRSFASLALSHPEPITPIRVGSHQPHPCGFSLPSALWGAHAGYGYTGATPRTPRPTRAHRLLQLLDQVLDLDVVDGRAAGLIMLFVLGIALGMLRERTGGVLASVVLHGVFNAANVALVLA